MKKLTFGFLIYIYLFLVKPCSLNAGKPKLTVKPDYQVVYDNIPNSFFQIGTTNDFNPILNRHSDDEGYTFGMYSMARLKKKHSFNFLDIAYKSDLYTKYLRNDTYKVWGRKIIPQLFVEITSLGIHYQYFIMKLKGYLSIGFGTGIYNQKRPIPGLPLFIQGGYDGRHGYHGMLKNNPGEDNIPTGEISPTGFVTASVIKYLSVFSNTIFKGKSKIEYQPGVRLGTKNIGSELFINSKMELPLKQLPGRVAKDPRISLNLQSEMILCRDGLLVFPEFGTSFTIGAITAGFNSIFSWGKQKISVTKYADNDILMRLYVSINFR